MILSNDIINRDFFIYQSIIIKERVCLSVCKQCSIMTRRLWICNLAYKILDETRRGGREGD